MDHTEKLQMTSGLKFVEIPFDKAQVEALDKGATAVILTPDDILTLRLLRDEEQTALSRHKSGDVYTARTDLEQQRTLDTLNRILKQVE